MEVDYIVIGAGSAGCAVAARLSKRVSVTVALLEAGGTNDDPNIHIPAAFPGLFNSPHDWAYHSLTKVEDAVKIEQVGEFALKGIRCPLAA
jgi:choline dehydrogenase-like flavoprotein